MHNLWIITKQVPVIDAEAKLWIMFMNETEAKNTK